MVLEGVDDEDNRGYGKKDGVIGEVDGSFFNYNG